MDDENKTETTKTTNTPDPWDAAKAAVAKVGLTPDDIIKAVSAPIPEPKKESTPANQVPDVGAAVAVGIAKWAHEQSTSESEAAKKAAIEALTKDADEATKELREAAMIGAIARAQSTYPNGHPLAGQPKPLTSAEIAAIQNKIAAGFSGKKPLATDVKNAKPPARPAAGAGNVPPAPQTFATEAERIAADVAAKKAEFIAKLAASV